MKTLRISCIALVCILLCSLCACKIDLLEDVLPSESDMGQAEGL